MRAMEDCSQAVYTALIKPVGDRCNLACNYCFYRPGTGRPGVVMRERVVAATIQRFLAEGNSSTIFAWQGGEPTLAGVEFYQTALDWQKRLAGPGQRAINTFQTNGVLIDEKWADFLTENQFLVGLSIDGPADLHDAMRRSVAGSGSHALATRAWRLLRERGCEVNVLRVVHRGNCNHVERVYRYLTETLEAAYLQFIPCINAGNSGYGRFLVELFRLWAEEQRAISIKLFDDIVLFLTGKPMRDCMHRRECDSHLVVERDGSAYPCDFFVDEEHHLGNVCASSLSYLRSTLAARAFRQRKEKQRPKPCRGCRHFDICQSGCCRFWHRSGGESWSQELCPDILFFLDHCRSPMELMAMRIRKRWQEMGTART